MTEPAEVVRGLRDLADFIEANPGLPWSKIYGPSGVELYGITGDEAAAFAAVPGGWDKSPVGSLGDLLDLHRDFGGVTLRVIFDREMVCERKVVGTETVEVPDPDAPKVTVEREIVEWKCASLLAKATA